PRFPLIPERTSMCGIVGIFDLQGQRDIDAALLARLTRSLRHRGPDEDGMQTVEAEVPQSEMYDFTTYLRQLTQGQGSFTFEFTRYDPLPQNLEGKVIEDAKKLFVAKSDDE
ncbi:MAG: hypothetical protein RR284_07685, partial [Ruthenibacterium sp.]